MRLRIKCLCGACLSFSGLECAKIALTQGTNVVFANKAPLVLAYTELMGLAQQEPRCGVEMSGAVCGGLPVVNVGRRDLHCAVFDSVEGILNSTSNYILTRMGDGEAFEVALKTAQARGIAEADPSLDIQGFDTANKLVIIANAVLGYPAKLDDVAVTGIEAITPAEIAAADAEGCVYRLVATATIRGWQGGNRTYTLTVAPKQVPATSLMVP